MAKKKQRKKVNSSRLMMIIIGALVIAQLIFNIFTWYYLVSLDNRVQTTDIAEAYSRALAEKKMLDSKTRIPEARLQILSDNNIDNIRYTYIPSMDGFPETIHITTNDIANSGIAVLRGTGIVATPTAGSCGRGFIVNFDEGKSEAEANEDLELSSGKHLRDGRNLYIWREKECYYFPDTEDDMKKLEKILLQIDSY